MNDWTLLEQTSDSLQDVLLHVGTMWEQRSKLTVRDMTTCVFTPGVVTTQFNIQQVEKEHPPRGG